MQDDAPAPSSARTATPRVLSRHGGVQSEEGVHAGQPAFIKTCLTDEPQVTARFLQEGQIAAGLSHPLIVPLLSASPRRLVFPWISGVSLRERLERGALPLPEALSVVCGVLSALVYVHAQGVTHQDVKPENVLLAGGQAEAGAVRLTDFGMSHSRALGSDLHEGTRMGTPHFMAPEQFRGVRGDPRSDLYSAGVLLFDCLAGHPPFQDALGWLTGLSPERAPLPGPPELHPLLDAALSRDLDGRPQTAQDMLRRLREVARFLGLEGCCPEDEDPCP
ncbi:serine/threonine-protein kinase [Deinococcus hopiensis]|uniref:serine/threonine-protein kinase n=1 Tax=Deinococcus hopiensis TaxID=309885 RepID=UPI001FEAEA06|nr:serine/threonine-protein kinase [Deinococcus hopiensis]